MSVQAITVTPSTPIERRQTGGGGKAAASFIAPGLGQLCDDRTKAGLTHLGLGTALTLGTAVATDSLARKGLNIITETDEQKQMAHTMSALKKVAGVAGLVLLGGLALRTYSAIDAYKGNKGKAPEPLKSKDETGGGGKAVASAFLPGLGQLLDGRTKQGLVCMFGTIGLGVGSMLFKHRLNLKATQLVIENAQKLDKGLKPERFPLGAIIASTALSAAHLGAWMGNVADAYKGNQPVMLKEGAQVAEKQEAPAEEATTATE